MKRSINTNRPLRGLLAAATLTLCPMGAAVAGPILSAIDATIKDGGPGFGSIIDTINQNGLETAYVSGVTDFDTYIAGDPLHTALFTGFEWFSNQGSTSASITYDLGSVQTVDAFALWNEEFSGIGILDLLFSTDNTGFTTILTASPTNTPQNQDYSAQVFAFAAVDAQYFRLDASGCPQSGSGFDACSIGEVAFRQGESVAAVPEPHSLALLGLGLALFGAGKRRKTS